MKDQTEVSSLSRGIMLPGVAQPLSSPLQAGLALSVILYPHCYQRLLRVAFPCGSSTGLPSSVSATAWVRPSLFAGGVGVHDREEWNPCARHVPFWLEPVSRFGSSGLTTFIKSSHLLAIPRTLGPLHFPTGEGTFPSQFQC